GDGGGVGWDVPGVAPVARLVEPEAAAADPRRDAEIGDQPLVDRWRLENAIEGAAERGVDEKVRRQDAVVVNRLVVAAVLERAVAGRGLLGERPGARRPHRAGRRSAEDRAVEPVGGP